MADLTPFITNIDDVPLSFGKHKGESPNEIAQEDPGYIVWIYDNIDPKPCTKDLRDACELDEAEEDFGFMPMVRFDGKG